MFIVDSQIHIWQDAKMSAHHRQIPTYSKEDALKEMAEAGVDAAVLHPPSTLGEGMNRLAGGTGKTGPEKFLTPREFYLTPPTRTGARRHSGHRPGTSGV